jgi:hypothetical protein
VTCYEEAQGLDLRHRDLADRRVRLDRDRNLPLLPGLEPGCAWAWWKQTSAIASCCGRQAIEEDIVTMLREVAG